MQKRCPKCGGNIYLDRDLCGWYEECLQCSHTRYLETIVKMREQVSKGNLGQAEGRCMRLERPKSAVEGAEVVDEIKEPVEVNVVEEQKDMYGSRAQRVRINYGKGREG